ncbi:hypothetical protein GM418_27830 [Maribellus comscasis]|uniref:Histidine kinase domain-containing protein n=1 Tax=Maribellus comscasis TaxID=2681766 RepID=A0A6I6K164_9BACT|nr:histidine kinase [Maribellus comscasis]QGY47339.1 hypothetical protein GM418_27830 [Maribellus comscasis]
MKNQIISVTDRVLLIIIPFLFLFNVEQVSAFDIKIEHTYKHYTIHEGLLQMQVMDIFQDSKGYLWCSTKAGLSRFDGKSFKNFSNTEVDVNSFDYVTLGGNSRGDFFQFSEHQMIQVDEDSLKAYPYPKGCVVYSNYKRSDVVGLREAACFDSIRGVVSLILNYENPDSLFLIQFDNGLGKIIGFDKNSENLIWQTDGDSIYVSDIDETNVVVSYKNPGMISEIIQNKEYTYGINSEGAIYKLTGGKFELLVKIQFSDRYFKAVPVPENNALIIKTSENLYYYKDKIIPIKQNFTSIRDLLIDNESNIWVATEEGLYNFFDLNFVNYSFGMGNKDWVWSVIEGNGNNMWFASYQNGIWKWDGETVTDYTKRLNKQIADFVKQDPAPNYYRYYMGASKFDSAVYFPTECNVLKYRNGRFSPVKGLADLPFQMTKPLTDSTFACMGYPGLYILKDGNILKYLHRDSIGVSSVLNAETDKNSHILAVGRAGVALIKEDTIVNYNQKSCLKSYSTAKDHKNNIWIGGIENINMFNGDSLLHVALKNEEAFYSILFVEPHYLLFGGLKGIYVVNLDDYYKNNTFEMLLFDQKSGFTGIECGQNGFFTDSKGMAWIPTSDYVTSFNPENLINKNILPPRIYLKTEISTDNIAWKKVNRVKDIMLKFNENNLRFRVDAVSFANVGNIRYYYQLTGLQDNWTEASEINEITFYQLKPGKYTFQAKADPGVSKVTSEIVSIHFEIEKPYWAKVWFIGLLLFVSMLIIAFVILLIRKAGMKKAMIQQRIIQLRSEALAAQLDPHFVMNCLNNISGLVNSGYKKQATDYIVKFSKLLRVILQSIKKEVISLSDELEIVENYIHLELLRCDGCFTYQIKVPGNYASQSIMVPPMILQPLVENSIKHGFENGKRKNSKIEIRIEVRDRFLVISIEDNGRGINKEKISLGTGLGTKITRERIDLLHKKANINFEVKNRECGVEVSFLIPLVVQ